MNSIQDLINQADTAEWPYPKLFESLKNQGVTSYFVDFTGNEGYNALYRTKKEIIKAETPPGYIKPPVNEIFSEDKIKEALADRMQKNITYAQFLCRIADAGVTHYHVDMEKRQNTYCNKNESHFYVQNIPHFFEENI